MRQKLPEAIAWLEERQDVNTLVHCAAGVSRSATIVIALFMKRKQISLLAAYQKVIDVRPFINPNNGFFEVLQEYQD